MVRHELENIKLRLKALEAKVAEYGVVLTETLVQTLERKNTTTKPVARLKLRTGTQPQITERQQYLRDHVLAAAAYEGSVVEYAAANNLKTKDLITLNSAFSSLLASPVH